MQRVRVEVGGEAVWGRLEGERIHTDDGRALDAATAAWLAPATPTKIVAVHLTYRSRLVEYAVARMPADPSYFMKPPDDPQRPPAAEMRRPHRRALPQLRGRDRGGRRPADAAG